jgi:hypothetical protein
MTWANATALGNNDLRIPRISLTDLPAREDPAGLPGSPRRLQRSGGSFLLLDSDCDRRPGAPKACPAERDRLTASVMSEIVQAELGTADKPSGTQRARGDQDESGAGQG